MSLEPMPLSPPSFGPTPLASARSAALAPARHGDARRVRFASIAVVVAIATAHRVQLESANLRHPLARSGLIGSAAEGVSREVAELAVAALRAQQAAAGAAAA